MTSRNSFPEKIVVVAKSDTADYKTIGEAIKNSPPETRILVKPGIYQESLVINKPLEILGDGQASDIVIESTNASCILMQTEYATVRGLTVRGCKGNNEYRYFAVSISRRATVEDCDIYRNAYSGVAIDTGSNPRTHHCRIYDSKQNGIWVKEKGLGIIEDCDIYGNTYSGVKIQTSGNPTIRQCRIYDGKQNGIWVKKKGLGTIEDCDIYRNAYSGVLIDNSNPTLRRCHIHDGKQEGISIQKSGKGTIQYCRIERHPSPGIKIQKGCHPVFRRCTLKTNKPSYLELVVLLGFSMALITVALFEGWAISWKIPLAVAVGWAANFIVAYRLRKKGFGQQFSLLVICATSALGFNLGITVVFGFNLYILLALLGSGVICAMMIFYPAFEQAKLMSKYDLIPLSRNKISHRG